MLPEKFRATFEQVCGTGVLRGEIRYHADVPVVVRAPSRLTVTEGHGLTFQVEGTDETGAPVALEATGLPEGAAFADGGAGTGGFSWTPEVGRAGAHRVGFRGRSASGPTDEVFTRIDVLYDFDNFDRAIPFSILTFRSTVSGVIAGVSEDDPECFGPAEGTVWYAFTPAADIRVHLEASNFWSLPPGRTGIGIFTGGRGALVQAACGSDELWIEAKAGTDYFIMVATRPGATLSFRAEEVPPPPPNDDIGSATSIEALPFGETLEVGGATFAADEPASCFSLSRPAPGVWYAMTPAEDTRITVDTTGTDTFHAIDVLTGPPEAPVAMACGHGRLGFTAAAGRNHYLRLSRGPFVGPGSPCADPGSSRAGQGSSRRSPIATARSRGAPRWRRIPSVAGAAVSRPAPRARPSGRRASPTTIPARPRRLRGRIPSS
jgi:hypothetical protein